MTTTVLGHSIDRREDAGLLTGATPFLADLDVDGVLHAVYVRSTVAHGVLRGVDLSAVRSCEGVVGAFAARDLDLAPMSAFGRQEALARPLLAVDRVRYVGEAVAVVVGTSHAAAVDAVERAVVDVEVLPAVTDPLAAMEEGAPLLFPDHGSNVVLDMPAAGADDLFADADRVLTMRFVHRRVAPVTMEPNGLLAVPGDPFTVWASTQSVFGVRREVARVLGLDESSVRVTAAAIGGGFGAKGGVYPEQLVTAAVAMRLGAPVRWVESRTENLLNMTHGRGSVQDVEVGVKDDGTGTIVAMRVRAVADTGAYSVRGVFIPFVTQRMASGCYRIPRIEFRPMAVVTNTTPTGPYRGAGRPEAAAMCERVVDVVADGLGLDPVAVRRANFVPAEAFPYTTATGAVYDTGEYERALDEALRLADYDGLRAEQALRRRGEGGGRSLLGIGVSSYVEVSGMGSEFGSVQVHEDGSVTVVTGSVPHGQGHETVWAQIAASVLRVPVDVVRVVHSDTSVVARGTGTFGSRSLQLAGSAVLRAAGEVVAAARQLVADAVEAAVEDVVLFDDGRVGVAGAPVSGRTWAEVAALSPEPLLSALDWEQDGTYPFGAHVAVVEVDVETGLVSLRRLVAVDDCGTVVNPRLAEGQVHGGLGQGVAQVLFEEVAYDADGNPLTSTLVDYLMPSAADLPSFEAAHTVTPTPKNPLGAKGIGESGTTGSIAAVWNAVVDALSPYGVRHLDPPFSPERVWRALRERSGAPTA